MAIPWLKKNPFLSMWLSAANLVAGTLRGQATAQTTAQSKRQVKGEIAEAATPLAPVAKARAKPRRKL
jgi:hypothetical protein